MKKTIHCLFYWHFIFFKTAIVELSSPDIARVVLRDLNIQ